MNALNINADLPVKRTITYPLLLCVYNLPNILIQVDLYLPVITFWTSHEFCTGLRPQSKSV